MRLKNLLLCLCLSLSACSTLDTPPDAVQIFVDKLVSEHQFDKAEVSDLLRPLQPQADILKKITSPAEALPWYRYRKLFLTETQIDEGVKFWQDHAQLLAEAQRRYGVPAEIIVAIIGVETRYGRYTGKHRVLDALYTLAFDYPARSAFFQKELENYLLLCREEHLNPAELLGSYAGAMGMPQFMPSSFRNYAADFDRDGHRDIWHNDADVIASIANYFAKHHWQVGQGVALPATASGTHYQRALNNTLKPDLRLAELESLDLKISVPLALDTKVNVLALKQEQGEELWVGLDNFYCLTRYNQSPLYAMAVFQLSQAIVDKLALNRKGAFP